MKWGWLSRPCVHLSINDWLCRKLRPSLAKFSSSCEGIDSNISPSSSQVLHSTSITAKDHLSTTSKGWSQVSSHFCPRPRPGKGRIHSTCFTEISSWMNRQKRGPKRIMGPTKYKDVKEFKVAHQKSHIRSHTSDKIRPTTQQISPISHGS